jgi:hypothetical protein
MGQARIASALVIGFSGCGGQVDRGDVGPDATADSPGPPGALDASFASDVLGDRASACDGCDLPDSHAAPCPRVGPGPPQGPLDCAVNMNCPNGGHTSLSGTVRDPAGRNPLYDIVVFVPDGRDELAPIPSGVSVCNACSSPIGGFVSATLTDATGAFRLLDVPTGTNVPLVLQVGKWRRAVTVPVVADCEDTTLSADLTRLPRNRSEGDMPQMAVLTGGCDNLACFLRSVGIDAAEFSAPHGGGRVDVYQGVGGAPLSGGTAGDCTTAACPLWDRKESLEAYDKVLLGCECAEHNETKPASALLAMHDWLNEGGKIFATHSQLTWLKNGPPDFAGIANWTDGPSSGAVGPFAIDMSFPHGKTMAQWLANVGGADANGFGFLTPADVSTSVTTVGPDAIDWINDTATASETGGVASGDVTLWSVPTPLAPTDGGPRISCGAAYPTDIHAGGPQALRPGAGASSVAPVPAICDGGPLTAEEEALEFLFFDDAVCVSDD